jgi:hypothetical protein
VFTDQLKGWEMRQTGLVQCEHTDSAAAGMRIELAATVTVSSASQGSAPARQTAHTVCGTYE